VGWLAPVVALAALAVVVAGLAAWRPWSRPAPEPDTLIAGVETAAGDAPRTVRGAGHEVRVEVDSEVVAQRVEQARTELRVVRGAAAFRVRHLQQGERFSVSAGGLTVEAVGTQFAVALEGPCARVEVSEGTVEVRRPDRSPERLSLGASRVYCQRPQGPEVLTDQERLVFGALDDLRRGDYAKAIGLLEQYQQRFPHGAYEEEALFYLARLCARVGRAEDAKRWKAQFLERFPHSQRAAELRR
jgi:TolA-binding protein